MTSPMLIAVVLFPHHVFARRTSLTFIGPGRGSESWTSSGVPAHSVGLGRRSREQTSLCDWGLERAKAFLRR